MHSTVPAREVAPPPRERHRRLADPRSQLRVDDGRRGLLDQLLVTALHRAVALAEEEHVPARVGDHLRLDVMSLVDVPLEEYLGPAEVRLRLAGGPGEGVLESSGLRTTCIPRPPPPNAAFTSTG